MWTAHRSGVGVGWTMKKINSIRVFCAVFTSFDVCVHSIKLLLYLISDIFYLRERNRVNRRTIHPPPPILEKRESELNSRVWAACHPIVRPTLSPANNNQPVNLGHLSTVPPALTLLLWPFLYTQLTTWKINTRYLCAAAVVWAQSTRPPRENKNNKNKKTRRCRILAAGNTNNY